MQLKVTCTEVSDKDQLVVEIICGNRKTLTIRKNKSEANYLREVVKEK